ncbi:hypothetical protein UR09_01990 [Candidatus Nitromaritima sp. SCGC AAA799-A02]|nr:hypothetical protein UZ36_03585 [Candidatus Nitromaritima sp. SCGC AAA799-C22]KMP12076.1 hypothetical protein UR09_01990 [Candidatus Nitromaritima sp. SCGC AAA799-A02]
MDIVYDILIQVGKIIFLLLILVSLGVSAMILFWPRQAAVASARFNRWISTEKVQSQVDTHTDTDDWIFRNRWWIGGIFLIGALFSLKFLLFDFEQNKFISLVINPNGKSAFAYTEIAVEIIKWILALTSFVGVFVCILILFNPDSFKRISSRLNRIFSTTHVQEKIDVTHMDLDQWVMKNHIAVGLFLFLGSCFLIVFSMKLLF